MLAFRAKLFDGFLKGTGSVYTQTADAGLLGAVERITVGLIFNGVTGTANLTLQFENSPDGTRWINQSPTAEIDALPLSTGDSFEWTTNLGSREVPIGGFVRIRLALGGTSPSGHVRLWVVGRNPAF